MDPRRQMIHNLVQSTEDAASTIGFRFFKKLQQACYDYNVPFHALNPSNFQVRSGDEETLDFLANSMAKMASNLYRPAVAHFGPSIAEKMLSGINLQWD